MSIYYPLNCNCWFLRKETISSQRSNNIARSYHEVKQFSLFITYKVELKAEKPSHRTFASLCDAFKCLVNMDSLVSTYTKRCAVYETNTGTFSQKNLLYKDSQRNGNGLLKFHKTVI